MKMTTFILLLAVVLSGCAQVVTPTPAATLNPPTFTPIPPTAIPTKDPKALAAGFDALVLANNQAGTFDGAVLVARITLDAIAEKQFGNGKQ